jgi:hypothetical protein
MATYEQVTSCVLVFKRGVLGSVLLYVIMTDHATSRFTRRF